MKRGFQTYETINATPIWTLYLEIIRKRKYSTKNQITVIMERLEMIVIIAKHLKTKQRYHNIFLECKDIIQKIRCTFLK